MNKILVMLKGIYYRIIGREWITAPKCNPVPIYIVEDVRVKVIHRGIRVVEDGNE